METQSNKASAKTMCNGIDWAPLQDAPLVADGPQNTFHSASELLQILTTPPFTNRRWAFRGQANAAWALDHSLDRLQAATVQGYGQIRNTEQSLESDFRRSAHHYLAMPPPKDERIEWLALMRHHGVPSRLLDWTWSPYVAAFFAAVDHLPASPPSAIWALDMTALRKEAVALFRSKHPGGSAPTDEQFLDEDAIPFAFPIEPSRNNERLTAQQGLFLCPNSLEFRLELCLKHTLLHLNPSEPAIRKIVLEPSAHCEVINELYRMNISEASLFPGLDGFARSLGTRAKFAALAELEKPPLPLPNRQLITRL
jgi:hypothetical protein